MIKLLLRRLSAVCLALAALAPLVQAGEQARPLVLTGMQATYSIASALTAGTSIEVRNVPADGRELAMQKDYVERRMAQLAPTFREATAVVTLTNALPADPLYRFAREANIRIVNIDAALPWSLSAPGVGLAEQPVSNVSWGSDTDGVSAGHAPYFWLSISNAIRMTDIVAGDLRELFPESAAAITVNLERLKQSLLGLRAEYQNSLLEAGGDLLFALSGDFVYLTNDMALLVDGYFIKQDVRWKPAELAALTKHLKDNQIKVVLHRWMPNEAIQAAVRAGGAKLVVLDTADPGIVNDGALAPDGLQRILRNDLEAIRAALLTR